MAHETALAIVNAFQDHVARLARTIADALDDTKLSAWEGMAISMQGMQVASAFMMLLQSTDSETRKDVLWVLEHVDWALPDTGDSL